MALQFIFARSGTSSVPALVREARRLTDEARRERIATAADEMARLLAAIGRELEAVRECA